MRTFVCVRVLALTIRLLRLGLTAVKAILGKFSSELIGSHSVLEAVTIVCDPKNRSITASIGVHLRNNPDWKTLSEKFWEGTINEAAQGKDLDGRLLRIGLDGANSPEWLMTCEKLPAWAKDLRKGRTDLLEAAMVRAITEHDSELQLGSESSPGCDLPELRQALAAEEGALAKLAALEQAFGQQRSDLSHLRRRIEDRLTKANQGVMCAAAVTALTAAADTTSVDNIVVACDSLRLATGMASVVTEDAWAALEAAEDTLQTQTLELPFDNTASFQLGYSMLDAQELAVGFRGEDKEIAAPALAHLHAQRIAMRTWEAINGVELAAALSPGRGTVAAQASAMAELATSLATWDTLSRGSTASPDQPTQNGSLSVNPADALPAARAAKVFTRGSAELGAYLSRNLEEAFDFLKSTALALEAVAAET